MPSGPDDVSGPEPAKAAPPPAVRRLPPAGLVAVFTALLGLLLFVTMGGLSQAANLGFGVWFTQLFIFLGVPWVLVRFSGRDPFRYVGLAAPAWRPTAYAFGLGVVNFFAIVVPLQLLSSTIAPRWLRELYDVSRMFEGHSPFELALIIGGLGLAAPFCEEIFFRGVVLRGLMPPALSPKWAVIASAVIFSAFHLEAVGFLARVELGALFGLLFLRTGSLWPAVAAHAANNLVATVLYFAAQHAGPDTEPQPDPTQVLLLAAIALAVLAWVIRLPRRHPSLLPARPLEDAQAPGSTPSFGRLAAPWVAAAMTAVALLAGIDSRGVRLNYWDQKYPLPKTSRNASPEQKQEREKLDELRRRARRGEASLDEYAARRRELSARGGGTSSPSTPAPPSQP